MATWANPTVQRTLRDKASRSIPDLERWANWLNYFDAESVA